MSPEEQWTLNQRVTELQQAAAGEATAAAILILGDRLVGVLDAILGRLRTIEERLGGIESEIGAS